jgi:hypothetical protein
MAKPDFQVAHTEMRQPASGEVVKFINIRSLPEGGVRVRMRGRHGDVTDLDLNEDEWQAFAARVGEAIRHGQT